jgi:hypothetical protein
VPNQTMSDKNRLRCLLTLFGYPCFLPQHAAAPSDVLAAVIPQLLLRLVLREGAQVASRPV